MDNAGYIGLSRQSGLMRELNSVANNIANINTNGYRREANIFAEHVKALQNGDPSLSIATMTRRYVDLSAGDITRTNNPLDVAIEGNGFFLVEAPQGQRLTRDGAFSLNAQGELVSSSGARVLDESGGAITIPPGGGKISITADGAINVGAQNIGKLGVVTADPALLVRVGQNQFRAENGYEPALNTRVHQFSLEGSNVSAVQELARLIEVQRTYEESKKFSDNDGERITRTVRALGQSR
ncbi:Flagellar basal-body rod protein FlgG [hydrothermal vent metagenome]|uniref:Flagellar basal-body rod protein FlgG n=1 Tax=hydrothermal vent metagenome TaxID=652676 RepID=A0A3B0S6Z8_9ZZZZ